MKEKSGRAPAFSSKFRVAILKFDILEQPYFLSFIPSIGKTVDFLPEDR
jgi:hypothetical protein